MITCESCKSNNVEITNTKTTVTEVCKDCKSTIQYPRIPIGKAPKTTYIKRILNTLKESNRVLITAVGNRTRTLHSVIYESAFEDNNSKSIEAAWWNIRKTKMGGLELQVLLKKKEKVK